MLSVWWPFGQIIASLVAWPLLQNYSCIDGNGTSLPACSTVGAGVACCTKSSNMGWRYWNCTFLPSDLALAHRFTDTMGDFTFLMFIYRFLLFNLFESPKFLLSRFRQREAVTSFRGIAWRNGCKTSLSEEILDEIGGKAEGVGGQKLSYKEIVM